VIVTIGQLDECEGRQAHGDTEVPGREKRNFYEDIMRLKQVDRPRGDSIAGIRSARGRTCAAFRRRSFSASC
jgi:hypothetical protein